ncbi:MAG: DUF4159 domain-containing protein [candidate division Zixibacteria bacterium]|nr:DUF4159 domain-containing protein [candidate division Zixibacteria bacterium]
MKRFPKWMVLAIAGTGLLATVSIGLANGPNRLNNFTFARVVYHGGGFFGRFGGFGGFGQWAMDFPSADLNIIRVLGLMTTLKINEPESVELTDEKLFEIPFLYILEVGGLEFDDDEAKSLREYLLRGGFMMVDDFHGTYEWQNWESQIKKVFPDCSMEELPMDHPVFHCYYDFKEFPQVPGIRALSGGRTYERDGVVPRCLGIFDDKRRLMVLVNWNTDIGDGWEEAATPGYERIWAETAYRLGVNYAVYAMTH